MNDWNIQSRAHACQSCERHFADKEPYHTLLQMNKHELVRMDVCTACWETKHAKPEGERKGFISHWQGVYHAPSATAAPDPIQKENAETLLRKLIEVNDPKHGPACYILAVMLERKRLLKIKEQFKREDGVRVFIYEHPKTGDVFTIADPNLQLDQLEEVQRDITHLLANGYNPDGETQTVINTTETAPTETVAEPAVEPAQEESPSETPPPDEEPSDDEQIIEGQ